MSAISVVSYQVAPGRDAEFIEQLKHAKSVIEPLGVNLRDIRMRRSAVAGPNTGLYRVSFEYDDLASWAATVAREAQDKRFNEAARQGAASGAATMIDRMLVVEIAPSAGPGGKGSVAEITAGRVKPGRMDDFLGLIEHVNAFASKFGVLSLRHFQVIVGGPLTGAVIALADFADMHALANGFERDRDPEWMALLSKVVGPDGPIVPMSEAIQVEIPL